MTTERLAHYIENPGSIGLLLKHQNNEAARLVLMKAADHLYERTCYGIHEGEGERQAIDLLDGMRDAMQIEDEICLCGAPMVDGWCGVEDCVCSRTHTAI